MSSSMRLRRLPLADAGVQRGRLEAVPLEREFGETIAGAGLPPLTPSRIDVLQINVGKFCNQTCRHCHVDAGPDRTDEMMTAETLALCLDALDRAPIPTVDITGGAPELHPLFRWLVEECRARGRHVIDRCNLTVLELAPAADLAEFLAQHQVEVVCSLPHYRALNTDRQRGAGVYDKSRTVLLRRAAQVPVVEAHGRDVRLDAVAKEFDTLPADVRAKVRVRLGRIQVRAQDVGWGFSDAVDDVIHSLDARAARVRPGQVNRR